MLDKQWLLKMVIDECFFYYYILSYFYFFGHRANGEDTERTKV